MIHERSLLGAKLKRFCIPLQKIEVLADPRVDIPIFQLSAHPTQKSVLVVMSAVATLSGIRVEPPQVFVVLSYLSLVVEVAILITMFHPDTDRYLSATHDRIAAS